MTENTTQRLLLFILTMGVLFGLLLLLNFSISYVMGNGAIYTGIVTILLTMYVLLKLFKVYLKEEMTFLNSFIVGLPVFAIGTIISFFVIDYDFEGTVTHSYYAKGYFIHMMEETSKAFIPITLIFALFFAPSYRYIKRKRAINPN